MATGRSRSARAFASNLEKFEAPRSVAPRTDLICNAFSSGRTAQVRPLLCTNLMREGIEPEGPDIRRNGAGGFLQCRFDGQFVLPL